jgi:hypothetical protein
MTDDMPKPMPKPKGGARPGAGRKPNNTKRAALTKQLVEKGLQSAIDMGVSPLHVMRCRMLGLPLESGQFVTDDQFVAAKELAPYLHPRLAAAMVKDLTVAPTTSVERIRRIEQLLLETASDDPVDQGTIDGGFVEVEPE